MRDRSVLTLTRVPYLSCVVLMLPKTYKNRRKLNLDFSPAAPVAELGVQAW